MSCLAALGAVACTGSSSGSSSSSGTGTSGGSTGSATTTTGGSGGTTGSQMVNGCDPSTATDITSNPHITISGFAYSPACAKVSVGTVVTIDASSLHPLHPGTGCTEGTGSPITDSTSAEMVTFSAAGSFGFYCSNHCMSNNMQGAVFVQ